jgi:hypothetical protein
MAEMKDGCVQPARGPILPVPETAAPSDGVPISEEVSEMLAQVGKEAPDFEANAFVAGKGFNQIKLSNYKGQWIMVCFYPGDFTFV